MNEDPRIEEKESMCQSQAAAASLTVSFHHVNREKQGVKRPEERKTVLDTGAVKTPHVK